MGSFWEDEMTDEEFDALSAKLNLPTPSWMAQSPPNPPSRGGIDLPITVGRPR